HSRDEHSFVITSSGIEIFAPRVTIHREDRTERSTAATQRLKTGSSRLDDLLGEGIPLGSTLLIAGVAGTGKTVLGLEFLYRRAQAGEKGIVFSFEETEERLRAIGRGLGWDLDAEINRGMLEIVFIPQPDIMVEAHLLMMRQRYIEVYKLRNTAHSKGRHNLVIGPGGIRIFPRYAEEPGAADPPPPAETSRRSLSGVPGLDELLGGGLFERSVTLVSGSAGI